MPCIGSPQLLLLLLTGFFLPAVLTGYPQAAAPTVWQEPPEFPSGGGSLETTPSLRLSDVTGVPADTFEPDPTHLLGNGDGSLGPGAVAAIVLAALLGTSVLVALIVITLRKFNAS